MVKEGIYIEEKNSTVGVGGTAKHVTFKSLWASVEITEKHVVLRLLDDKAAPTGLTEQVTLKELEQRFQYRPVKPEVWTKIKTACQNMAKPAAPRPKPAKPAKKSNAGVKSGNWWDT